MKTTKRTTQLALIALLTLATFSAVAQQNGGHRGERDGHRGPPDAEMRVARMTQKLNLTDEQSAQLLVVMQEIDRERDALKQQAMEQIEPELCEMRLRSEAEVAQILTDEQLATMETLKENKPESRHGRRGRMELDCSAYE